jgi:hypothetical protein
LYPNVKTLSLLVELTPAGSFDRQPEQERGFRPSIASMWEHLGIEILDRPGGDATLSIKMQYHGIRGHCETVAVQRGTVVFQYGDHRESFEFGENTNRPPNTDTQYCLQQVDAPSIWTFPSLVAPSALIQYANDLAWRFRGARALARWVLWKYTMNRDDPRRRSIELLDQIAPAGPEQMLKLLSEDTGRLQSVEVGYAYSFLKNATGWHDLPVAQALLPRLIESCKTTRNPENLAWILGSLDPKAEETCHAVRTDRAFLIVNALADNSRNLTSKDILEMESSLALVDATWPSHRPIRDRLDDLVAACQISQNVEALSRIIGKIDAAKASQCTQ